MNDLKKVLIINDICAENLTNCFYLQQINKIKKKISNFEKIDFDFSIKKNLNNIFEAYNSKHYNEIVIITNGLFSCNQPIDVKKFEHLFSPKLIKKITIHIINNLHNVDIVKIFKYLNCDIHYIFYENTNDCKISSIEEKIIKNAVKKNYEYIKLLITIISFTTNDDVLIKIIKILNIIDKNYSHDFEEMLIYPRELIDKIFSKFVDQDTKDIRKKISITLKTITNDNFPPYKEKIINTINM